MNGMVAWSGPDPDPAAIYALRDRFARLVNRWHWMLRLVDLSAALQARPWPSGVAGQARFRVEDPVCPWNSGTWQLELSGGQATVEAVPSGAAGAATAEVRGLASLFTGFAGPDDLVRAGLLSGFDPAAVERVQSDTRARMLRATDPYLRERAVDVEDVAGRVLTQLGCKHAGAALDGPGIVVANELTPGEAAGLDRLLVAVERVHAVDDRADLLAGEHLVLRPRVVAVERHELDEAHLVRVLARELREPQHLGLGAGRPAEHGALARVRHSFQPLDQRAELLLLRI
jgi:hypothetical protein